MKLHNPDRESLDTLVILTGQDRELSKTYSSMRRNLLVPLNADLAFCGVPSGDLAGFNLSFQWTIPEPENWKSEVLSTGLTELDLDRYSRLLHPQFFSGISADNSYAGNGGKVQYLRYVVGKTLLNYRHEIHNYDWLAITRSDFLWRVPFPNINNFDDNRIYFLDGEHYWGVEDRFILFPTRFAEEILTVSHDIFEQPAITFERYRNFPHLNAEVHLKSELDRRGLWDRCSFIPYLGLIVRSPEAETNRRLGEWDDETGFVIKYWSESDQAGFFSNWIRSSQDWGRFPRHPWPLRVSIAVNSWRLISGYRSLLKMGYPFFRRCKTLSHRIRKMIALMVRRIRE